MYFWNTVYLIGLVEHHKFQKQQKKKRRMWRCVFIDPGVDKSAVRNKGRFPCQKVVSPSQRMWIFNCEDWEFYPLRHWKVVDKISQLGPIKVSNRLYVTYYLRPQKDSDFTLSRLERQYNVVFKWAVRINIWQIPLRNAKNMANNIWRHEYVTIICSF